MFLTRELQNKNATIEVNSKLKFLSYNLELVTRKRENKSLTIELVTRSVTFFFQLRVSNWKVKQKKFNYRVSNSK